MRFGFFLLILLLCPLFLRAQEQEQKLVERIMKPDTTKGVKEQDKTFGGGKAFNASGNALVRDFSYEQRFSPKEFSTKSFATTKSHWAGDFKFSTKEASTKSRSLIPNLAKNYDTKTMAVKDARENGKSYASNGYETREFIEQGKSQKVFDQRAKSEPMTIDQVRELLNKNK